MKEQRRKAPDVPRTAWTPLELATSMGVGYQTVLSWIHDGTLGAIRVGVQYRIPESERLRMEEKAVSESVERRDGAA